LGRGVLDGGWSELPVATGDSRSPEASTTRRYRLMVRTVGFLATIGAHVAPSNRQSRLWGSPSRSLAAI